MSSLENLKLLKEDMERHNWAIASFIFSYKRIEYIVLVKRFVGNETKNNTYALVKLQFMKSYNLNDKLICEANINGLLGDTKIIREYFGIEYGESLREIFQQFYKVLNIKIPLHFSPETISEIEKECILRDLSISDSEDPKKNIVLG